MSWGNIGDQAAAATDAELADREASLLADTTIDWDALKPAGTDQATYDKLMKAVKEAQQRNETVAQIKQTITSLGTEAVALAKKLITAMP